MMVPTRYVPYGTESRVPGWYRTFRTGLAWYCTVNWVIAGVVCQDFDIDDILGIALAQIAIVILKNAIELA